MFVSTLGIVLRSVQISDSKYMLTMYTESEGRISVLMRRTKKTNRALTEGLTIAEITFKRKKQDQVVYLSESRIAYPYDGLVNRFDKRSIATFINELLVKSIQEEERNVRLFHFIKDGLVYLDRAKTYTDFHLWFMVNLTQQLGFAPQYTNEAFLDLNEGRGVDHLPSHNNIAEQPVATSIARLLSAESPDKISLGNRANRNLILSVMVSYFKIHLTGFNEMKSVEVLQAVFSEMPE